MSDEYREALAEEIGYIICPIVGGYTLCDEECEQCAYYIGFVESVKEREKQNK